jgi:hypothetical protein
MFKSTKVLIAFFLLIIIASVSCRKVDKIESSEQNNATSALSARFFDSHKTDNPIVNKVNKFVKGQNEKYNFLEDLSQRIGFPRWDKAIVNLDEALHKNFQDSIFYTFVPFVRESQEYVNATLIVKTSGADTVFKIVYDNLYRNQDYSVPDSANSPENIASLFFVMDFHTFGITKHKLFDGLLFNSSRNSWGPVLGREVTLTANTSKVSKSSVFISATYTTCVGGIHCEYNSPGEHCYELGRCDYLDPCPTGRCWPTVECTDINFTIWASEGGGSSGGSPTGGSGGGFGTGSSGWNNPCNGGSIAVKSNLLDCTATTPGWVATGSGYNASLAAWENSIIIDPTLRPCLEAVFNQVKALHVGQVCGMIMILDGNLPSFEWTIREQDIISGPFMNADAVTQQNSIGTVETYMNTHVINNASTAFIARTFLHEAVHAFIFNFVKNRRNLTAAEKDAINALSFGGQLRRFLEIRYPDLNNTFHKLMAEVFRRQIQDAIKAYCQANNIGAGLNTVDFEQYCYDMSWGGLDDTDPNSLWMDPNELTDADRARIEKRLEIEKNNLGSFVGTYNSPAYGSHALNLTQQAPKACQ